MTHTVATTCIGASFLTGSPHRNFLSILRSGFLRLGSTRYDDCADAISDYFIPAIYHAPPVHVISPEPPHPRRPYDDNLNPRLIDMPEWKIEVHESAVTHRVPTDGWCPRELI